MTLTIRIILSLLIAVAATVAATLLRGESSPDLLLFACFAIATLVTALLPAATTAEPAGRASQAAHRSHVEDNADREEGKVKWFNVSKGFGFIIREDGDEIFVHFRSIRGDGRRSLRDGQRVGFVVGNSAKGPQAEDVVALD
ncbi:cold-shock protein [Parahaliea maris]|uniref:Cold-shock protein n=1 Tax=Parahaliea maris TaxID=2716870 RepID=A0A5C9A7A3_9GAMM|nr:cold-shock protein [Parahaliea maris]